MMGMSFGQNGPIKKPEVIHVFQFSPATADPFSFKRSLTRLISAASVFDYIGNCFKIAYLYFGCIQTTKGPIITRIQIPDPETANSSSAEPQPDTNRVGLV